MQHSCPHCGFEKEADGFETLDESVMHECQCENCREPYVLFFVECEACMHDSVFSWATEPSLSVLQQLSCECCANLLYRDLSTHVDSAF
jgi:hypothetical protein